MIDVVIPEREARSLGVDQLARERDDGRPLGWPLKDLLVKEYMVERLEFELGVWRPGGDHS